MLVPGSLLLHLEKSGLVKQHLAGVQSWPLAIQRQAQHPSGLWLLAVLLSTSLYILQTFENLENEAVILIQKEARVLGVKLSSSLSEDIFSQGEKH